MIVNLKFYCYYYIASKINCEKNKRQLCYQDVDRRCIGEISPLYKTPDVFRSCRLVAIQRAFREPT